MKDETIDTLNELLDVIQNEGWNVTSVDMDEYSNGRYTPGEAEVTGAEVELQVHIDFTEEEEEEDDNPYRVK